MYELENLSWSWMFLLIVLIGGLFIIDRAWKIKTQRRYFSSSILERLSPNISMTKPFLKVVAIILSVFMFTVALINPKMGTKIKTFKRLGVDIVFAIDVSKSMLAEDIAPNRIEKSKQIVNQIIDNLDGDRVGIVAYAGKAFPQLPLTTDYSAAKMYLQSMNTDMISSQGTAIEDAISISSTFFDLDESTERLLFIISDGEDHNNFSNSVTDLAKQNNILIYPIGVGTEKGSLIPIRKNGEIIYKRDVNREVVMTKLNKNYLENLSDKTGGKYIDGSKTKINDVTSDVMEILENTEKNEFDTKKVSEFEDQFQWFIFFGFIFLVIDVFMTEGKTIWLKNLNLFNEK